jgi:tRNA threonylcarbamoyladenosine biosynthesis protein TsaE
MTKHRIGLPSAIGHCWQIDSLNATATHASQVASVLPTRAVIGLIGTLGAGKTQWVRSLVQSMGLDPREVTSPTFAIWQTYQVGTLPIHHLDAYRLQGDEWDQLGVDEAMEEDPGWTIIEWADRVACWLPAPTLWLEFDVGPPRCLTARGDPAVWGARLAAVTGVDGGLQ